MTNIRNILFYLMIAIVIALSIYVVIFMQTKSYSCISNPLVFGVQQYHSTDGLFTCQCSSPMSKQSLLVTKDNITLIDNFNYLKITP